MASRGLGGPGGGGAGAVQVKRDSFAVSCSLSRFDDGPAREGWMMTGTGPCICLDSVQCHHDSAQ